MPHIVRRADNRPSLEAFRDDPRPIGTPREAHPPRADSRRPPRDLPGDQPPDPPQPRPRLAARLPRRPRPPHGHPPRRHQPDRQRPHRRGRALRGRQGRGAARPQAQVPLHRLAQAIRHGRRCPTHAHVPDGDRPADRAHRRRVELPHPDRPGPLHQDARRRASAASSRTTRNSASARASAWSSPAWWTARAPASRSPRASAGATSPCATCSRRRPGLPVHIENSGRACAIAQVWGVRREAGRSSDFVFLSVSDGLGVGFVVNGEVVRGRHNVAGEFGHVAAERRRPALRVRRDRAAGRPTSRTSPRCRATSAARSRRASPSRPRSRRSRSTTWWPAPAAATPRRWRRSSPRRITSASASARSSTPSTRRASSSAARSSPPGICSKRTVRQALATRVLAPAASSIEITPCRRPIIRGCAARPPW